jgi:2-octaprenyl-6-methoxyphenol hydroxylase
MSSSSERFDVLIVGGGPVGLALGLALTRSAKGIKVGLVDRRPLTVPRDNRATAVAAGVRRVFEALGVWGPMAEAAQPITAMRITDSGTGELSRPLFLNFAGDVVPGEPFAHMVPNGVMAQVLLDAAADAITVIAPAEIESFSADATSGTLTLADGRTLVAPLVVGADGGQSRLRAMAGIGVVEHDYKQSGLVTTISHELPHEGAAYEHFRPAGPFASLPLKGNRSSLVWTEASTEAPRFLEMPPDELNAAIESVMGSTLGAVTAEDKLQAFPLKLRIARDFVAPRLALIGDAIHVVHPVAGQGLNLGLKDVAALAEVVVEALRLGLDHGSPDVLTRYQSWRRFDVSAMAMVTDTMNRLFSNDIAPIRAARDFGLGLVDRADPIKSAMIRAAAGIDSNGPRLLSGLPI